jgi:hypothetical protein
MVIQMRKFVFLIIFFLTALSMTKLVKSENAVKIPENAFLLTKGIFIANPFDLPFQPIGSRKYPLPGGGFRAPEVTENFWIAKNDNVSIYIRRTYVPGIPNKKYRANAFIDDLHLKSITTYIETNFLNRSKTDDISPVKIVNDRIRGYYSTIEAENGLNFNSDLLRNFGGHFGGIQMDSASCITVSVFSRLFKLPLRMQSDDVFIIIASIDCENNDHKKAIEAVKSLTG